MEQTQGGPFGSNTRPLTTGEFVIMFILQIIPIVNIIMLFVWAFGANANLNKKSYARAMLILWLIALILWIIIFVVAGSTLGGLFGGFTGLPR